MFTLAILNSADWLDGLVFFSVLIMFVIAALWCTWSEDQQCLWDKVVRTYVVRVQTHVVRVGSTPFAEQNTKSQSVAASPTLTTQQDMPFSKQAAENLRTLAELHERGLLTDEEYEERRAREAGRL